MVYVKKRNINGIPLLDIALRERHDASLPLIIFIHGFESIKEMNLHYAYLLAERGYRTLLPEAVYHGERSEGLHGAELKFRFWEIVTRTIGELDTVKEHYVQEGLADPSRVGVAGTSMGGVVTLGALCQFKWIKAGVSLMGNPAYEKFAARQLGDMKKAGVKLPFAEDEIESVVAGLRKYDLSLQPEKLAGRPLLFWHGALDPVVPIEDSREFYAAVRADYHDNPDMLKFIEDPTGVHKVSIEGIREAVDWFSKHV